MRNILNNNHKFITIVPCKIWKDLLYMNSILYNCMLCYYTLKPILYTACIIAYSVFTDISWWICSALVHGREG